MSNNYPYVVIRPNGTVVQSFESLDRAEASAERHADTDAPSGTYVVAKRLSGFRRVINIERVS